MEFHSDAWRAVYVKRIDATIAALKSGGVPVFWVGLPPQRNSRMSSDWAFLNELYRARAERAGIVYVDVWDGFVDEAGRYSYQGPDFEGQIRRLRSGDGIYFTKAGARKLAHYVDREIQRSMANRATPVALPAPEPAAPARGGRTGPRPLAGPVVPLTAPFGVSNELLGGPRVRPVSSDPVANRVLTRGEPIGAPPGRADNFAWPHAGSPEAAAAAAPERAALAPAEATPSPPPATPAAATPAAATPASEAAAPAAKKPAASAPAAHQPHPAEAAKPRAKAVPQQPAPKRAAQQQRPRADGFDSPPRPPMPILPR
jgi:hypothetical protein